MKYFRFCGPDIAIDMGTANTLIARVDQGIIIKEPTVVALDIQKKEVVTLGQAAKDLIGKSPDSMISIRPLRDGVISDFELTQALLEYYIRKANPGVSLTAPRVIISIPSGATDVEQRALEDAVLQSGARDVILVDEPVASAYGAGLVSEDHPDRASLIVDLGAGTCEAAIVTAYGVLSSEILYQGGEYLDKLIQDHLREEYSLIIGDNTAENIKNGLCSFRKEKQTTAMDVGGRDSLSGMPRFIVLFAADMMGTLEKYGESVVETIQRTIERTPPEVAGDIIGQGVQLTGGLAQLDGFDEYLRNKLYMPVQVGDCPEQDTIKGAIIIMKNWKKSRKGK